MSAKIYRLADGAEGLFVKNERFNTTSVSFNFYLPLAADTAAAYALLPFILTTCGEKYPDFSVLNYKLAKLYGKLRKEGIIDTGNHYVSVLDPKKLQAYRDL